MTKYDVYGVGNALVDTEFEVHDAFLQQVKIDKGTTAMISREERKSLLSKLEENEHQVIKSSGGGSAANTIVAIAQLGGKVFYSCKVAQDDIGDFFLADLKKTGVDTNMTGDREEGHTGECISMVTADAERTMATHLGITADVSVNELDVDALKNSRYLYIEGYLLSADTARKAAREAQTIAQNAGVKVSLTLSDPALVEHFKDAFDEMIAAGIDLLFCNKEEAMLWTGAKTLDEAIKIMSNHCPAFVITLGADGSVIYDGSLHTAPAIPVKAVDTTGAGDIFAGAFLYGITNGMSYKDSGSLGNKAASLLVESFGARLKSDEVSAQLKNWNPSE